MEQEKSTLLKMLNGIFMPDKGLIKSKGKVGALIEVGAGFHPLLTGRENIYVNASILGLKKKEIDKKFDEIVEFSGLESFIDSPVKHYSSGMYVRLGFSVAVHVSPDILLVDEVLAVGDMAFNYKCYEKIRKLKEAGVSIIFVSHNSNLIKAICDRVLVLEQGKMYFTGKVDDAMSEYNMLTNRQLKKDMSCRQTKYRRGTGKVRFTEVKVLDKNGKPIDRLPFGTEKIKICVKYFAEERVHLPYVWMILCDARKTERNLVIGGYSSSDIYPIDFMEGNGEIECELNIQNLGPNLYGLYMGDK